MSIAVAGAPVLLVATALARNHGYLTSASLLGAAGVIGLASTRTPSTTPSTKQGPPAKRQRIDAVRVESTRATATAQRI